MFLKLSSGRYFSKSLSWLSLPPEDSLNTIGLVEVYDNSHIQGTNSVGALITYSDEGFIKKRYRKFNIKSDAVKGDDYGMMKEVLGRRFSRALKELLYNLLTLLISRIFFIIFINL